MAKGISLHLGLNKVNPKHYGGWDGALAACEFDAKDMRALAKSRGFQPTVLLTKQATAKKVTAAIEKAAGKLEPGDIFFLTYSGHGGQMPDVNGDENDKTDETWVLYDRELVDDELYALWGKFQRGVRIIVLSDSCHSGTATRDADYRIMLARDPKMRNRKFRAMPKEYEAKTYKLHKKQYDKIQKQHAAGERVAVGASILLISGCQDNQLSADGDRNGLFTETLRKIWDGGKFKGNYTTFHRAIQGRMPSLQSPNFFRTGASDVRFEHQGPFTI